MAGSRARAEGSVLARDGLLRQFVVSSGALPGRPPPGDRPESPRAPPPSLQLMVRFFHTRVRFESLLAGLLILATLATDATAQLDLPGKSSASSSDETDGEARAQRKSAGRNLAPHLVCTRCAKHNYGSTMGRPTPDGFYLAYCTPCGRDMKHSRAKDVEQSERLHLPQDSTPARLPKPGRPVPQHATSGYADGPAASIFSEVASLKKASDPLVRKAVEALLGMGAQGLDAARSALHDSSAVVVVTAGRVLIRSAGAADAERLLARLRDPLPGKAGAILVAELVRRDPVHASPEFLVELLDHPQQPVRQEAQRSLAARLSPAILPLLEAALVAQRTDTRLLAMNLVIEVDDPAVTDILLEHLPDKSARVSSRVLTALAEREDARIDLELLARAFRSRWILRENAYALLALVAREDLFLKAILDERHIEPLLMGLESGDALTVGACAAALAGIGYRSSRTLDTAWLDRDVVGFMIAAISGQHFHADFSSLQPRILKRLVLLTGEDFGSNGPAWTIWWVAERAGFYARRAWLSVAAGGADRLEVHFRSTGSDGATISLIGAGAPTNEALQRAGVAQIYYLTERECRDLLALMEREGVLSPERVPGRRGRMITGMRTLEILVDGRGKIFSFGPGEAAPWFDRLVAAVRDLGQRNLWQRYPDEANYASPREAWETEAGWWALEHSELERAQRMKGLVAASVTNHAPSMRSAALKELVQIYAVEGVANQGDFGLFLDLLRDEGFFTVRARQLVNLALQAASSGADGGQRGQTLESACDDLLRLLLARFQLDALPAMGKVARKAGRDFVRRLATDDRPALRAVAATELGRALEEGDGALLLAMLNDPAAPVEAAAALALGQAGVEEARTELLLRARLAEPFVRRSALRAVGNLGGEYVLDALVLGVSDPDPNIKLGAAEGLADLQDPRSASLFIALLRQDRDSEIYAAARRGLIRLGPLAREDLLRVARSPAHRARREVALLLGQMCAPEIVPALIDMIEDDATDALVGFELATLTCVDARAALDPAALWAEWYDEVVHDRSLPWFLAALERRGMSAPPGAEYGVGGSPEAALLLLDVLGREEDFLVERARRELGRILDRDLGRLPLGQNARELWLSALREAVLEQFASSRAAEQLK